MDIINHPCCTRIIGAPADMLAGDGTNGTCSGLPVAEVTDEYGTWSVSFWKPTPEELARVTAGGTVALWVRASGRQHPVVALNTQPPEAQNEQNLH